MPSPFPGMDPYLEAHWLDVHTALVAQARGALNRLLPAGLVARVEERIAVESSEDVFRRVRPDVRVVAPSAADLSASTGGIAIEAPYKLVVDVDPILERFIRILDNSGQLITVIEFISPTNKRPPGLEEYKSRRTDFLTGGVHLVEIDLVRAGNWRALMRPAACPPEAATPYRATIWTSSSRPEAYLYPIPINAPLPEIDIPLRPSDTPVRLPLQPLLTSVYQEGRYDQTIDYRLPPDPPLDEQDAAWTQGLLKSADRR